MQYLLNFKELAIILFKNSLKSVAFYVNSALRHVIFKSLNAENGRVFWIFVRKFVPLRRQITTLTYIMLQAYLKAGRLEAGCDEAGRGCLAGPVYAAAVILPFDLEQRLANGTSGLAPLNDSKQLTERQRYELRPIIEREALAWAVGVCDNHEIDRINILRASIEAMHRAVRGLGFEQAQPDRGCPLRGGQELRPEFLLIDGNRFYPFEYISHQTIVKGDGKMMAIAAASILAKTYRDDVMNQLHREFPNYSWDVNKGYPTKAHRAAIAQYGVTPYHRLSYRLLPEPKQLEITF